MKVNYVALKISEDEYHSSSHSFSVSTVCEGLNMHAKHRIVGVDDNQMDEHLIPFWGEAMSLASG